MTMRQYGIDQKLYAAFTHKAIPLWVNRNYNKETRTNVLYVLEAVDLIIRKCKKEGIKTEKEYDEKISIHYSLKDIIKKYFDLINDEYSNSSIYEICQGIDVIDEEEFLKFINKNIKLTPKTLFDVLDGFIIKEYLENEEFEEAEKKIKELILEFPSIKKELLLKLAETYVMDDKEISEINSVLQEVRSEFKEDLYIIERETSIYCDYMDYHRDEWMEENITEIQKIWNNVKKINSLKNVKTEKEYEQNLGENYLYEGIIVICLDFYENFISFSEEEKKFIDEAMSIIEIQERTKELLISALSTYYCVKGKREKGLKTIDEFIEQYPTNSRAILTKANICMNEGKKLNYEKGIKVIEDCLDKNIDDKNNLYANLAMLYDKNGNEEKANEYQQMIAEIENEVPF